MGAKNYKSGRFATASADLSPDAFHARDGWLKRARKLKVGYESLCHSSRKSRAYVLWAKIKAGVIRDHAVPLIQRDYAVEFAEFARQEALISSRSTGVVRA